MLSSPVVPIGWKATLNATVYYAQIDNEHQLDTPVFKIRAIFNTTTDQLEYVYISIIQTNELDQLLEFDGGSDNRITPNVDNLVADGGVHVFDTPINLVQDPTSVFVESDYPINLGVAITLLAVYHPGISISMMAEGLGCIQNATGEKNWHNISYY